MITRYVSNWCPLCQSLTFIAERDEVCNCEPAGGHIKEFHQQVDRAADPVRSQWVKVTVTIGASNQNLALRDFEPELMALLEKYCEAKGLVIQDVSKSKLVSL